MRRKPLIIFLVLISIWVAAVVFFKWSSGKSILTTTYDSSETEWAKDEHFTNCIIVRKQDAILVLAKKEIFAFSTISNRFPERLKGVGDLNIIYSKEADYKKVMAIVNAVSATGMQNYRLLKM